MKANVCRVIAATVALSAGFGLVQPAFCDVVTDWNEKAAVLLQARMPAPPAFRAMAMVNVAIFDALNSIERRYQPYLTQLNVPPTTSPDAAVAAAAGGVLLALLPPAQADIKTALAASLAAIPDGPAKTDGIALGEAVAMKILQARDKDGAIATDTYRPRTTPGIYVTTAPTLGSAWGQVKPFAMTASAQFRPAPPIKLDSPQWVADYNEIRELGSKTSTTRSARQTEDARFWLFTGPQAYFPIAMQVVAGRKMNLLDGARFMALESIAISDAIVAVFEAKFHYDFWRPVTAIRNGDQLNNSAIARDAAWQPIDATPMFPEYPCAHCIAAAAFAAVVDAVVGPDVPELSATSPTAPGVTHRWTNVRAFVSEVSEARITAGFHFRFSTKVGEQMGNDIGHYTVKTVMQPIAPATR